MDKNFSSYPRVQQAFEEKAEGIGQLLISKKIDYTTLNIFIRAFKNEKVVELWGKNSNETVYQLLKTYDICRSSGELGPKRQEGDYQVPEGFYYVDRFNPKSDFHLSLGLNYPNVSDKILGNPQSPGSDIFIHGGCVTVGCLPLTNDKIKEFYIFAEFAKRSGQTQIPVHIFPFHLTTKNILKFENLMFDKGNTYKDFWLNLKSGYDYFYENKEIPTFTVNEEGQYIW